LKIVFVLVDSEDARNVGASARAMFTMGHQEMRLVRPKCDRLSSAARALAHGSETVLENSSIFTSLEEATLDCDLRIAATARHRKQKAQYVSANEIVCLLNERSQFVKKVALVFGGEGSGLCKSDIAVCDILTTIPQACLYPSVNLSQAVMVYSYELSSSLTSVLTSDRRLVATREPAEIEYAALKNSVREMCEKVGIDKVSVDVTLKRMSLLSLSDLRLIHKLRHGLKLFLERNFYL
jgi:tRNA/rRNA methyltransferase